MCVVAALCFAAETDQPPAKKTEQKEYIISPDDVVEILVYGEPDLSITTRIPQDGFVNYPLVGKIKVAGLTERQLEEKLNGVLGEDYLVSPQVNVSVRQYAKISILGEVKNPGSYEMKEMFTLTQAIAVAGGFTNNADPSQVKIIRMSRGNEKETIEVDVGQIADKVASDVELKGNDTIIVGEFGRFSIMGQVTQPGMYTLKKDLTVLEAIGLAGGFSPLAVQNGTRILRVVNGEKKIIYVPAADIMKSGDTARDVKVEPGDTIVVPETFF
jgi:polysaccharide export outer membrane protein